MATKEQVAEIVAMIGSAYPNFAATKATVVIYYEVLKDLPADLLHAAAMQSITETGRAFAPSVGELRGAVADILRQSQEIPSTLEAWDEVCNAPKSGEYKRATDEKDENGNTYIDVIPFEWSHPLVKQTAERFGWPKFPDVDNLSVDRAHFIKQYDLALNDHLKQGVQLPEVKGYIETARATKLEAGSEIKQLTKGMTK